MGQGGGGGHVDPRGGGRREVRPRSLLGHTGHSVHTRYRQHRARPDRAHGERLPRRRFALHDGNGRDRHHHLRGCQRAGPDVGVDGRHLLQGTTCGLLGGLRLHHPSEGVRPPDLRPCGGRCGQSRCGLGHDPLRDHKAPHLPFTARGECRKALSHHTRPGHSRRPVR